MTVFTVLDPLAADPFRIFKNSDAAYDLDPNILFTSRFPGAFVEEFTANTGGTGTATFIYSRIYSAVPWVFAVLYTGGIIYPYMHQTGVKSGTNWIVTEDSFQVIAQLTFADIVLKGQPSGVIRGWVLGS